MSKSIRQLEVEYQKKQRKLYEAMNNYHSDPTPHTEKLYNDAKQKCHAVRIKMEKILGRPI